jgi:predicted nucleic acid-binding protein
MSSEEEKYNLTTKTSYRPSLLEDMDVLLISFITIIHHYIIYFFENKETIKPNIMNKGIQMLSHIFVILLHYSKNLGLTIHHSKTSIVYYVEYINQITDKDDNMFFNLSLKDAIIYVYTKTIYVVPEDIRQKHLLTILEKQQLENIQENIHKYCHLAENIVILTSFQNATINKKEEFLKDLLEIIKLGIINLYTNSVFINETIYKKIEQCNIAILEKKDSDLDTILGVFKDIFNNNFQESVEL